ncbi:MAG: prolipoprotein diacylglyceryl transferase [Chloroflexi bacterium CSP1-4]|nr:MAG: prolipoprotein diacylglyceryl transferase [Chloroflexi bacterium CSP1-4]
MIEWTPDATALQLGPLALPWYGIGYAVAIAVGVWLVGVEARRRGLDASIVGDGLILVVVCGVIGARMYHVIDQWQIYQDDLLKIVLPPYSGLALYGGVGGGIVGVFLYTRRRGQSFLRWADAAVPSLFIGQAIARWGNFFNQELYGPPTGLPWGLAIDCAHRVAAYPCSTFPLETTGFHPLFFYESALTLTGGLVALWLGRRFAARLRDGDLLSLWFIWYGVVRALLETFREGWNWVVGGIPVAILISLVVIGLGVASIAWRHRGPRPVDADSVAPVSVEAPPPG